MAAVMLTGCVNATTSTTDNSKADKQATEVSEEQKSESIQEENTHETEASASLKVQEYHDWQGIDMPFPQGWEVDDIINRTGMICLTGSTESDPVYYGIEFTYDSNYQDQSNGHTLEELPEYLLFDMDYFMYRRCKSSTNHDFSRVTVDSSTEAHF